MAQVNTVALAGSNGESVVVKGSYRSIKQKILNVLASRKEDVFLVKTVTDKSNSILEYYSFTDISNFLHELEYNLIPKEEMEENAKYLYKPLRFVNL